MKNGVKKHIRIKNSKEAILFTPIGGGGKGPRLPKRDKVSHAEKLEIAFNKIWNNEETVNGITTRAGIYLQFRSKEGYDLITKSLEDARQNVRLCNIKKKDVVQYATVFVPKDKKNFFLNKIEKYKTSETSEKVIASIEAIEQAVAHAFWTDEREMPRENKAACKVWLSVYGKDTADKVVQEFFSLCDSQEIEYYEHFVKFPERAVVSIMANLAVLTNILRTNSHIAEFRRNSTPAGFFVCDNNRSEQEQWVNDLLSRTTFNKTNLSICILDTGVKNAHPLLAPVLSNSDMHTTFNDKIVQDISQSGHGTGMAGIATYFDLASALKTNSALEINHHLESVRFFDENIQNKISMYADVTSAAISKVEIAKPHYKRVIAMAVTSGTDYTADKKDNNFFRGDGKPTSWSAGIDNLALGNYGSENAKSRLIIVSAGNTSCQEIAQLDNYKEAVTLHSVENPAQSWNALTVGAFTENTSLSTAPPFENYKPLVEQGGYSPLTSSSLQWDQKWPVKPDIVFEGGNVGIDENTKDFKYDTFDHLSLLTTGNKFHIGDFFTTMNGTSPATAQAVNLAIRIMEQYPDIWPQTVRAIMVHSATWTDAMIRQEFENQSIENINKTDLRKLLRIVGYGKPDITKALYSFNNSVNLVVEDEIQPFKKENSDIFINEMGLHKIPWPSEVLMGLGETIVKMRVTLSYFIDPSHGEIGWENKYRYPGCRLLFDVNNVYEDKQNFLKRINRRAREEAVAHGDLSNSQNDSGRWLLGKNSRDVGSVHSDIWEDTAANLAEDRYIAVYPGGGWWKYRTQLKKYNEKIKYALIISISTPDESVDLYTPIQNQIDILNKSKNEIKVSY